VAACETPSSDRLGVDQLGGRGLAGAPSVGGDAAAPRHGCRGNVSMELAVSRPVKALLQPGSVAEGLTLVEQFVLRVEAAKTGAQLLQDVFHVGRCTRRCGSKVRHDFILLAGPGGTIGRFAVVDKIPAIGSVPIGIFTVRNEIKSGLTRHFAVTFRGIRVLTSSRQSA